MPNNPTFWNNPNAAHTIHPLLSDYTHATPESQRDEEIINPLKGLILHSPNGKRWRIQVNDAGTVTVTEVTS